MPAGATPAEERPPEAGRSEPAAEPPRRRPRLALLALLAVGLAYAWPMHVNGYNQNAHYALVRALADGVPYVDRSLGEIGDVSTQDIARFEGHIYAVKPPGLAMATVPWFLLVEATGMRTTGDPTRVIWALNLVGSALAALILLVLVRWIAERIAPGYGTATAVVLGLGTMLLSFATLFFNHALSTLLGFAAFALLWRERDAPGRPLLVAAAGLVLGLGVTVDYQLGVGIGIPLALYAVSRTPRVRRGLAYAAGVTVGVLPLALFNLWAFGSLTHTAYESYWEQIGGERLAYFSAPRADVLADILFSAMGLVTLAPVLVCGLVGAALLVRRRRAEALVLLGVTAIVTIYQAGLGGFGGQGPPRYLMPLLPFVGVGLALTFRRLPLTTIALAAVSVFQAVVMTATGPLAAYDGEWLARVPDRDFPLTAASLVGITGWYSILAFFAAAAVAVAAAALASPRPAVSLREVPIALAALLGWALVALQASNPYGHPPRDGYVLAAVLIVSAAVLVLALALGGRPRLRGGAAPATRPSGL
jgi:hypothetical protein